MKEKILLFSVTDAEMKRSITQALLPLHMAIRAVDPADFDRTLGALAGLPETEEAPGKSAAADGGTDGEIAEPMMVFVSLPQDVFHAALDRLRERGVSLPNKAVLTPTNSTWTPRQLYAELQRERREVARQLAAKKAGEAEADSN